MAHKTLHTQRLILRPLVPDDYLDAFRWCSDKQVNRFMSYGLYTNSDDVRKWLETLPSDDPSSFTYGIIVKENNELIGSAGMYYHEDTDTWSFGYNILPSYWNKGIATEAMKELLSYVMSICEVKVIEAEHAVQNPASGRIMEKLGLKYVRDGEYRKFDGSETFPSKVYRIEF